MLFAAFSVWNSSAASHPNLLRAKCSYLLHHVVIILTYIFFFILTVYIISRLPSYSSAALGTSADTPLVSIDHIR